MRFGAVLKNKKSTVRFGPVFSKQESYGAVLCDFQIS